MGKIWAFIIRNSRLLYCRTKFPSKSCCCIQFVLQTVYKLVCQLLIYNRSEDSCSSNLQNLPSWRRGTYSKNEAGKPQTTVAWQQHGKLYKYFTPRLVSGTLWNSHHRTFIRRSKNFVCDILRNHKNLSGSIPVFYGIYCYNLPLSEVFCFPYYYTTKILQKLYYN